MSVKTLSRVWDHSRHDGTALVTILALADWADDDGICWYSNQRIGQRIRKSTRSARRMMNSLRNSGEVFAPPNPGAGNTTLKFVCIGMSQSDIEDVLIRRFNIQPLEAQSIAKKLIKRQKREEKGDNPDPFIEEKGDSPDPFIEEKGDNPDRKKGTNLAKKEDKSGQKGDKSGQKGDRALSPDPYISVRSTTNDPSVDPPPPTPPKPSPPFVNYRLDPKQPFDARLLAIADVCGLDVSIPQHRGMCEQAASQLFRYDAAYIRQRYSINGNNSADSDGWNWFRHDFRGRRGDMPTTRQLVETIARPVPKQPPASQETAVPSAEEIVARALGDDDG